MTRGFSELLARCLAGCFPQDFEIFLRSEIQMSCFQIHLEGFVLPLQRLVVQ